MYSRENRLYWKSENTYLIDIGTQTSRAKAHTNGAIRRYKEIRHGYLSFFNWLIIKYWKWNICCFTLSQTLFCVCLSCNVSLFWWMRFVFFLWSSKHKQNVTGDDNGDGRMDRFHWKKNVFVVTEKRSADSSLIAKIHSQIRVILILNKCAFLLFHLLELGMTIHSCFVRLSICYTSQER